MAEPLDPNDWLLLKNSLAELERRIARIEQALAERGAAPATSTASDHAEAPPTEPAKEVTFTAPVETLPAMSVAATSPTPRPRDPTPQPAETEAPRPGAWHYEVGRVLLQSHREQPAQSTRVDSAQSLEKLIGGRWFTWLGAASLALAVAFFVPWAWRHFELAPWLRVLIFHLASVGVLASAYVLHRKRLPVLAHGIAGLGIFMLYASAFAMEYHYKLWGPRSNLATLIDCSLITAAAIAIAVRYNSVYIVALGALGAYVTPLISARGPSGFTATFIYLAFLNAALITTASIRPWRWLKPIAVAATAVMFLIWIFGAQPPLDAWRVEWMLALHAALFLAGTTVPPLLGQRSQSPDLAALAGNSLWFVFATWLVFHFRIDQQLASVSWGMSALHAVLFGLTFARLTNADRMPRVHLALAAVFLTLAVPLQLRDTINYLAYVWAVEGLIFTAVGVFFRDRQMATSGTIVLMLAAFRAMAWDFLAPSETLGDSSIDRRMFVLLAVGLAMAAAGRCYWWLARAAPPRKEPLLDRREGAVLMALGNLIAMIGLTRQWDGRIVLMLWTLDAAALWAVAGRSSSQALRAYALLVSILFVGGRVLFHGAALHGPFQLLTNDRFISLALVALLYWRAGWFERRRRLALSPADLEQQTFIDADDVLHVLGHLVMLAAACFEIHNYWQPGEPWSIGSSASASMQEHLTYSVVWAVYAAAVSAFGFALKYPLPRNLGQAGLLVVAAKAVFLDLPTASRRPLSLLANERFGSLAIVAALCLATGWFERRLRRRAAAAAADDAAPASKDLPTPVHLDAPLHVLGNIVLLAVLSAEVRDHWQRATPSAVRFTSASMEEMLSYSVVWAAYAAALVAAGFALKYRLPRLLGLGVLLAVAVKVLLVDLAEIKLIYRVLVLTALGACLLLTSFWYQKFTARIESAQPE